MDKLLACRPEEGAQSDQCGDGYIAVLIDPPTAPTDGQVLDYTLSAAVFGVCIFAYGLGLIIAMIQKIPED